MNPSQALYCMLRNEGFDFFVTVPCKMLARFIALAESDGDIMHVPATREEEGIGIATGAYLAGKRPVVAMQNSGLGNSINALASLARYYAIPLVLVVSHRGTAGEKVDAQRPMGEATRALLAAIQVPYEEISDTGRIDGGLRLVRECLRKEHPAALLLPIQYWSGDP